MLFKGLLITSLSGSMDGVTASRNKGGSYLRKRAIPTNPNTSNQQIVRGAMGLLTSSWNDDLTAVQRDAWQTYADNVTLTNPNGDQINVSGQNMFIRYNIPAIQVGLAIQNAAPTTFNLGPFTEPTLISASAASQDLSVGFDNTDAWANETGSAMAVYISRPQNQSINFFRGPYQFSDTIDGDDTTAPTSPAAIAVPFPITDGQELFARIRVLRADGRLSSEFFGSVSVTSG